VWVYIYVLFGGTLLVEKTIGNYRIIDCIGSGGMGDVYIGEDIHLKRKVAIKALKPKLIDDPDVIERFKREAVTLARLNHSNIATIYALLEENKNYYIITELVSGWPLSTFIEKTGALPLSAAFYFFKQVLAGIGSVHAINIVHRDLKPSNIMINENLIVKVMDFGLARFQTENRLTRFGKLVGTIEYMSPEQILGKDITAASDIYSLGVLLFEMVTGCLPFSGNSDYDLMKCQVENPPPSLLEFKADVPEKLVNIISQALDKNPQARFPSAEAFSNALDQIKVNTNDTTFILHELICSQQSAIKKTIDCNSPLKVDGLYQDQFHPGTLSRNAKEQTSSYTSAVFSRLILFISERPWVGPLMLVFSITVAGGLILNNNSNVSHNTRVQEQKADEHTHKDNVKTYDSKEILVPLGINTGTGESYHYMSPKAGAERENDNEDVIDDPTANPVQSSVNVAPVQQFPKVKRTFPQQVLISKDRIGEEKASKTEEGAKVIKSPTNPQTKVHIISIPEPKTKNDEWIIHK
jgi:serine/threonine protein kinase